MNLTGEIIYLTSARNDNLPDNISEPLEQGFFQLPRNPVYLSILYSFAYILIMVFAVLGNVMVIAVVVRNPGMHTVTNYFIVNLAVADIMVAVICMPITLISNLYYGWHFGWLMCKATPYLQGVSVCASVNTLAAIAVDRYLAICHSMSSVTISKRGCKVIVLLIWITGLTIMVPWAIYYQLGTVSTDGQKITVCYENWPAEQDQRSYFLGAIFLCCYSVPLVSIIGCYFLIGLKVLTRRVPGVRNTSQEVVHRSKVKAVKMLAVVVLLFAFSWLPLYVIKLKMLFYGPSPDSTVQRVVDDIINPIAQWLGSSNSGVNPIIYYCFSKRYMRGFKEALTSCCCKSKEPRSFASTMVAHSYVHGSSSSNKQSYLCERMKHGGSSPNCTGNHYV